MKESDEKYNKRIADAEQLTEDVQAIYSEIRVFEDAYKKQVAPLKQKIAQLEESFLNKWLVDSTGRPVCKGMVIEKDGKRFQVLNRYQQCIFRYLGNARVSVLPEGKKRTIDIFPFELAEFTIVELE
ncbi:xylulose kinase [Bacteroides cellulosilyticus]|uniref:xylulose kinase n=1 Tax=Bacteroides cellulosilyticus TaxID=246787 RepID=UPI00101D7329|nr:xylulose kinase [Bacteroides cellulosilyticus]